MLAGRKTRKLGVGRKESIDDVRKEGWVLAGRNASMV